MSGSHLYVCGLVAYDGTEYHGFQAQLGVPTIQDALESALSAFAQADGRVVGSGRTDAGVHAAGQVISANVVWRHDVSALQRAWNAHLPQAIALRKLQIAPVEFHPRFSAVSRTYRYTVFDGAQSSRFARCGRSPLTDRFALFVPQQLDVVAMQTASRMLLGRHDFAAFGRPPQGENSVRQVMSADWQVSAVTWPDLPQRQVTFTIRADAFLRQMVRNIVGTLLEVGSGRWLPEQVTEVLASRDRGRCAPPAPPQGLVLERVDYPAHFGLDL